MPFCPCGQSQYQTTQAKNKETNQRVGQLPAGPQWNCDTELCQQFSPWMDPFQHFPANTRRHLNPSKQSMATGVSPPDHPVRRDAEWVATPEETLSGDLPGCFVVWSHRQHSHTSQPNIIESSQVTQEERQKQGGGGGEEKRAESPSPTPQHVYRPGSVMCPPGHQPAIVTEGGIKPPKLSHCHYQKNLSAKVWLRNSVLPGCGDQNILPGCGDQNISLAGRYQEGRGW